MGQQAHPCLPPRPRRPRLPIQGDPMRTAPFPRPGSAFIGASRAALLIGIITSLPGLWNTPC